MSGITQFSPLVLQQAPVPIQLPSACNGINPLLQLCAGGTGTGTCGGDSGGPLFCNDNGVWVLQGITSYGDAQCHPLSPSVFTLVSSFVDWIASTMAGKKLLVN